MCMVLYSEVFLTLCLEDDTPKCQQHSSAVTLKVWTEKTPDVSQNYCHHDKDTFPARSLLTLKSTRWSWSENDMSHPHTPDAEADIRRY